MLLLLAVLLVAAFMLPASAYVVFIALLAATMIVDIKLSHEYVKKSFLKVDDIRHGASMNEQAAYLQYLIDSMRFVDSPEFQQHLDVAKRPFGGVYSYLRAKWRREPWPAMTTPRFVYTPPSATDLPASFTPS